MHPSVERAHQSSGIQQAIPKPTTSVQVSKSAKPYTSETVPNRCPAWPENPCISVNRPEAPFVIEDSGLSREPHRPRNIGNLQSQTLPRDQNDRLCPTSGARSDAQIVNAMDQITLKDYRCFHEKQTARLAPLTLLVGENSTGKTSFQALIRALWDVAYEDEIPDFKEEPYDLGSFDEIAHHRGRRGGLATTFEAGFSDSSRRPRRKTAKYEPHRFEVTFAKKWTTPVPVRRREAFGAYWIEEFVDPNQSFDLIRIGTKRGTWELELSELLRPYDEGYLNSLDLYLRMFLSNLDPHEDMSFRPLDGSPVLETEDRNQLRRLFSLHRRFPRREPFASAPVRSKPHRTYDPSTDILDSEGDYVPTYLANLSAGDKKNWQSLKSKLESFGNDAGLFDEITIKRLGKTGGEPFQVQVRKFEGRRKGPLRNLTDVGYGVSQVLPVVTALLRPDAPSMFLLQQPEVHLHPSAQAALGSLFCEVAGSGRQLVVETHSDHLLDRVRIAVRDGLTGLRPEDVSILFFERDGLEVNIHSLTIDEDGNINGQPPGYRKFFMEEIQRSLGL